MFYLEQMTRDKTRRLGEYPEHAYLIDPNARHRSFGHSYHRLKLAYDVWTQHKEDAWYILNEPVVSLGQFTLRLFSAPEVFRSTGIVRLAHLLYADETTLKLRNGASGQSRADAPAGSLPRLLDVLNQLQMNYDVYGMTPAQLLPLLPPEFDRFKEIAASQ